MKKIVAFLMVLLCLPLVSCASGLAPETQAVEKESASLQESKTEEKNDPKEDGELNVFFVSNSTCFYFTDELYGMLTAAGYKDVTLALAYYSGCPLEKHYNWLQKDEAGYQFRVVDEKGVNMYPNYSLKMALAAKNWDVISFDNNARSFASGNAETAISIAEPYFGQLHKFMKNQYPDARLMWHEVWANEIGYHLAFEMKTVEQRTQVYQAKRDVMHHMMKEYGVEGVPTGDAWEKVRDLPLFTTPLKETPEIERFTLNTRIINGKIKDDFTHDGDIGGGQYLNACVWFEILTGQSCLGNSFRPQYILDGKDLSLTEEKITILQNAAHEAVAEFKAG